MRGARSRQIHNLDGPGAAADVELLYGPRVGAADIIGGQNIHVIDVANWFLGFASRSLLMAPEDVPDWSGTKYDTGDAYDHFLVSFQYPNGLQADFSSNQLTKQFQRSVACAASG